MNPTTREVGSDFRKKFRIAKVDEATHTAYGIATSEAVDCDNEVADYDGSKLAFQKWSNDFLTRTTAAGQEASLGNIRLMHGLDCGGKVVKIDYNDTAKEVWVTSTPVNEDVWEMLKGGFLTGYSIGGKVTKRKKEGDYYRYWFELSELSFVDNPANPEATFAYVKADGSVELRKYQPNASDRLSALVANAKATAKNFSSVLTANDTWEGAPPQGDKPMSTPANPVISAEQYHKIGAILGFTKEGKTKRVAGEDLPPSAFAYVGDKDDPSTWKLPLHFSSEEKSKRHVRNALARFSSTDLPADEKESVHAKIVAAAKKYGIDVADEEKKAKAVYEMLKAMIEKEVSKATSGDELKKSMWQVGVLANVLMDVAFLYSVNREEAIWEGDDRDDYIAVELQAALEHLIEIMKDLVEEETSELIPALKAAQAELETLKGEKTMADEVIDIAQELADLAKAGHTLKAHFKKMAGHYTKMAAHHEKMAAHHEGVVASHDAMCEAHKACMGKAGDGDMGGFHKAGAAHHAAKSKHHGGLHKAHSQAAEQYKAAMEHCKAMGEHYEEGGLPEEKAARAAAEKAAADKAAADAAAKAAQPAATAAPATTAAPADASTLLLEEFKKLNSNFDALKKSVEEIGSAPRPTGAPGTVQSGIEVPRGPGLKPNGVAKSTSVGI